MVIGLLEAQNIILHVGDLQLNDTLIAEPFLFEV